MKKQEDSKGVEQVTPEKLLEGQTFYRTQEKRLNLGALLPAEFDAWVMQFVDEIVNVKRGVWDVYARWRFINWLIDEGLVSLRRDGESLLLEEKTSSDNSDELASEAS